MNKELKTGGLAIIIKSAITSNLYRTVKLVKFLGNPETLVHEGVEYDNPNRINAWSITIMDDRPLHDLDGDARLSMPFGESGLMPIGDDPDGVIIKEEQEYKA